MANSYVDYVSDGAQADFAVPFPYLSKNFVYAGSRAPDAQELAPRAFQWLSDGLIRLSSPAPAGHILRVYRRTPMDAPLVDFHSAATLLEEDLDAACTQTLHVAQEAFEQAGGGVSEEVVELQEEVVELQEEIRRVRELAERHAERHALGGADAVRKGGVPVFTVTSTMLGDGTQAEPLSAKGGGGGEGGTSDHQALENRNTPDQHRASAISISDDETLEQRLETLGGLAAEALARANPNILINTNGLFPVNQRGVPLGQAAGGYGYDRWTVNAPAAWNVNAGGFYASCMSDTPVTLNLEQYIEAPERYRGKTLTLSGFAASRTGTTRVFLYASTSGSPATVLAGTSGTAFHITWTVPGDTASLRLVFQQAEAVAGDWIQVLWVKLEEGGAATPWLVPDPQQELARCQRYYYRVEPRKAGGFIAHGNVTNGLTQFLCSVPFPVTLRVPPVASGSSASHFQAHVNGYAAFDFSALDVNWATEHGCALVGVFTAPGEYLAPGFPGTFVTKTADAGWLAFDAEM